MHRKTKKIKKKKFYGGEDSNNIESTEITPFDNKKPYSSIELGLIHMHAISLHHNNMNLTIIANLNIFEGKNSIYYPKNLSAEDIKNSINKNIINKYYGRDTVDVNSTYLNEVSSMLRFLYEPQLRINIFVGESDSPQTVPIFMINDNAGYFYDINGNTYVHTLKKRHSEKVNKQVYLFIKSGEKIAEESNEKHHQIVSDIANKNDLSVDQINSSMGVYDDTERAKYFFERIHITNEQKESIALTFLNYNILFHLNNDTSVKVDGTIQYKPSEQFNYFSYEKIVDACSIWKPDGPLQNEQFKHCLLVGFTIPYDNIRRPVYLKPNGFFSDGYADYYPTFETLTINEDILKKLFPNGNTSMDFLIGKIAYEFNHGPDTFWNISYNRDFRQIFIQTYLVPVIITSSLSVLSFLLFPVMAFSSSNMLLSIAGSNLYSFTSKSSTYLATVGYNDSVKTEHEYLGVGGRKRNKTIKKSKKEKY